MRGTRYLETEISSAYANKRVFDLHQQKLQKIHKETRNPFNANYLTRLSAGRRYQGSGKGSISPSYRGNQSILTEELSGKLQQMETPNKDTTNDTSRPDLTADANTPHAHHQTTVMVPSLKDKLQHEMGLNGGPSVRHSFIPQLSDFKSNGRMSSIPRENLFYGQQPSNIYDYSLQQSSRYSARKTNKGSTATGSNVTRNTKKLLMSQVPFTQNQQIMSSFLRANEYRQIEKLSQLRNDNAKMLTKLEDISKGKIMSVGHHRVHPSTNRPKTLHLEKTKREAEHIDQQNDKILKAILHVKPSQASQLDKQHIKRQQQYFNNISKSQKSSIQYLMKQRKQQVEQKKGLFPSILDYNKSINEGVPFGMEGEYKDGYRVSEEDSLDNYNPNEGQKQGSRLKKASNHNRSKSNLVVSHSYNIGSSTRNKLAKDNKVVNNFINQNSNQNTTTRDSFNAHQTSNEQTTEISQLKQEFNNVKNNINKQSDKSSPFKQETKKNQNMGRNNQIKSNPTAPQINLRGSDLNKSFQNKNVMNGPTDKIRVNDSKDLKNHIFGEDVGSVERLVKVEEGPEVEASPKSKLPKTVQASPAKKPIMSPKSSKAATPKKYSIPKVTPPLSSVYEDSFQQNSSTFNQEAQKSQTTQNNKVEQDSKYPKPSIDSSQPYSIDFGENPQSQQKSQFASMTSQVRAEDEEVAAKNQIMTPSNVGGFTPNVNDQHQSAEVDLSKHIQDHIQDGEIKFDANSSVTMTQPQIDQPQNKSQVPININKSMSYVPTQPPNDAAPVGKGRSEYSSNEIVSGQTVPIHAIKDNSQSLKSQNQAQDIQDTLNTGTVQHTGHQNNTNMSHEQDPIMSYAYDSRKSTQQIDESQRVNRESQNDLTMSNKVTTPIVPIDQVINQAPNQNGYKIPLGDDASSKNSNNLVHVTTPKAEQKVLESSPHTPNLPIGAEANHTLSAVEEGGSKIGDRNIPTPILSGRGGTTSPTAVMLKNQLNNNSASQLNSPYGNKAKVAVHDQNDDVVSDLDGGQPVNEEIEDMSDNYEEDFD